VSERAPRILAVLETSFWVLAYRAEVAANCLDLFDVVVPNVVADEIMASQPGSVAREYPYATLFRHLEHELRRPEMQVEPIGLFGPGEAEAIALAAQLKAVLLINERPAAHYARNLGLDVATVPAVIVLLHAQGVISHRAARRKLALIAANTARSIIEDATRSLDALQGDDQAKP
jgi:predicted nucleic acid-binding protein